MRAAHSAAPTVTHSLTHGVSLQRAAGVRVTPCFYDASVRTPAYNSRFQCTAWLSCSCPGARVRRSAACVSRSARAARDGGQACRTVQKTALSLAAHRLAQAGGGKSPPSAAEAPLGLMEKDREDAIACYRASLTVFSPEQRRLQWSRAREKLSAALWRAQHGEDAQRAQPEPQ